MDISRGRMLRKLAFRAFGAAIGGPLGQHAGDAIAHVLDASDIWVHVLEIAGSLAGGTVGGFGGDLIESEVPPSNPHEGDVWHARVSNIYYIWDGSEWKQVEIRYV